MKRDVTPERLVPAIKALRSMVMGEGFVLAELLDDCPLLRLPTTDGREKRLSRGELSLALEWMTGLENGYEGVSPELRLDKKRAEILRTLLALGEFRGIKSIPRRTKAMEFVYGPLSAGVPVGSAREQRRKQWDAYQRTDLPRLLRRVCQVLADTAATEKMPSSSQTIVAPKGYHLKWYETDYNFPEQPDGQRQILTRRHLVADAEVSEWLQSHKDYGHGDTKFQNILFGAGRLKIRNEGPYAHRKAQGSAYETVVEFSPVLNPGEEITFSLLRCDKVPWQRLIRDGWVDSRSLRPDLTIDKVLIRIRFPIDVRPREVWRYENLQDWLAPGVPSDDDILTPDGSGICEARWQKPTLGLQLGIAWRW